MGPVARPMTHDEWRAFVSEGTRTGKLGTVRADGSPHVVPVWVVLDGDDVVFNAGESTAKVRAMRHEARVSMLFDDERPPFSFVSIRGTATLSDDLDEVRRWATRIGARYMGEDRAEEFGARNGVLGELVVRVTPEKVIAVADMAD
jgi:PPOX class probable F420-dependent enzyme